MHAIVTNNRGMAMVLAISLIGLLSSLGIYLMLDSRTSFRMTMSLSRHEHALNLAEAAVQLGLRCVSRSAPSPGYQQLTSNSIQTISNGLPSYMSAQSYGGGTITPSVDYVGYRSSPPPGWMLNWQGYSAFHSAYYRSFGQATMPLPSTQGNATSVLSTLSAKVTK